VEHKTMAFNYLFNHLSTYPVKKTKKNLEAKTIKQIAKENNYLSNNMALRKNKNKKFIPRSVYNTLDIQLNSSENNKKWAVFTYVRKKSDA
jgi:hypothetical protein